MKNVENLLTEFFPYIFKLTIQKKNSLLLSSINYHHSIISTSIRALEKDEVCDCTVHPLFLVGNSFFNCQEDHFYNVNKLKDILVNYNTTEIDTTTSDLIAYLTDYKKEIINFSEYYSFYISSESFEIFIDNQKAQLMGDCASWCPIGCGSDHGRCGNYSGCCLYWHKACLVHDLMCTSCKPSWFCLPGCIPDESYKEQLEDEELDYIDDYLTIEDVSLHED